jgi:hypothetical protein
MSLASKMVAGCLALVVVALLVVGVVSATPIRHEIQVAPAVLVLLAGLREKRWVPSAATAVFVLWLLMMVVIWLYLLGIARIITGKFTPTEVALTIVIGVSSLAGIVAACRTADAPRWPARIAVFVVAAAVQFGAVWVSILPRFATR